jgi:hypothetical protein
MRSLLSAVFISTPLRSPLQTWPVATLAALVQTVNSAAMSGDRHVQGHTSKLETSRAVEVASASSDAPGSRGEPTALSRGSHPEVTNVDSTVQPRGS